MSDASGCSSSAYTHLDLFSGIGGFALAARRCGLQTTHFVEIDTFCQQVLQKNFPGIPIHDDIKTYRNPRRVSLVTAGYPCQPYSHAGNQRGADDDRALWPEVLRILQASRPTYFLGENVAGHISLGLDEVLSDLEGMGYAWEAFVIPACAVDAPHRRDRVWILAYSGCQPAQVPIAGGQPAIQKPDGYPPWKIEPGICRMVDGVPNRMDRLKSLGNAIVPQIAEILIGAMFHDRRN